MKPIFLGLMLFGMEANAQSIQPDKVLKSFMDQSKCLQVKNDEVGIIIKVDCYKECERLYALLQTYPEFYRILLPEGEKPEYKYFHFKDFNGHEGIAQFYYENGDSSVTLVYIETNDADHGD